MTIKFDHTNHKKLWNWLAENPDMEKSDWPEWVFNGGSVEEVEQLCFACQYTTTPNGRFDSCSNCPVIWKKNKGLYHCINHEFGEWDFAEAGSQKRRNYALRIANLPVKDGVETI